MGNNVGSLRKCVLDGVTYDVMSDCNVTFKNSGREMEFISTSGKTLYKMKKLVKSVESLELGCTPREHDAIAALAEGLAEITLSFTLAEGTTYKAKGKIGYEGYESESGKVKIKLIPNGDWTPFYAD
jgi:hypothetical protein